MSKDLLAGIKYQAAKRHGDVIHYSWVMDCSSQKKRLPLQPKSVIPFSLCLILMYRVPYAIFFVFFWMLSCICFEGISSSCLILQRRSYRKKLTNFLIHTTGIWILLTSNRYIRCLSFVFLFQIYLSCALNSTSLIYSQENIRSKWIPSFLK